jgi:hypothetical protein
MADAARGESLPTTAHDARVVKANLLNAASKVPAWTNGQTAHPNGNGGVRTTQSLDYTYGAGAMNLDRTYDQYLTGQADIAGVTGGTTTQAVGWDFAEVQLGLSTDIVINQLLAGGTEFRATLTWFRDRTANLGTYDFDDNAFADLNLQIWDSTFTTLYSESVSLYNETEHLAFSLPSTDYYGIRVTYPSNRFDLVGLSTEQFAVAWWGETASTIPEPGILALLLTGAAALWSHRRRAR